MPDQPINDNLDELWEILRWASEKRKEAESNFILAREAIVSTIL